MGRAARRGGGEARGSGCPGLWLACLVAIASAGSASAEPPERAAGHPAGRDLRDALARDGRARVVVQLRESRADWPPGRGFDRAARRRSVAQQAERVLARVPAADFQLDHGFEGVRALVGELTPRGLGRLLADPEVVGVDLDPELSLELAEAVPMVSLDTLQLQGHLGAGVKVAIVDTGIDTDHADLAGAVVDGQCFCKGESGPSGCCPNGDEVQAGIAGGEGANDHGTMVAGIVASNGTHAPVGGAPGVDLISVRVFAADGSGVASDVISAVDWVAMNHPEADVINMSLSWGSTLYSGVCDGATSTINAMVSALALARANGTLAVVASANDASPTSMAPPACIANSFSVGAVWDGSFGSQTLFSCTDPSTQPDLVACFSNRSPVTDLFAPGVRMTSSRLGGTSRTGAGTSYAAPLVAACAAILFEGWPDAPVTQIAGALRSSSVSVHDATSGLDYPRLDCADSFALLEAVELPAGSAATRAGLALLIAALGTMLVRRRRATHASSG